MSGKCRGLNINIILRTVEVPRVIVIISESTLWVLEFRV